MTDGAGTPHPTTAGTALPLPRYQSHKVVEALKIDHVEDQGQRGAILFPVDTRYPAFRVSSEYVAKHQPRAGYYWVRYSDNYESASPAAAFEEGYSLIHPDMREWANAPGSGPLEAAPRVEDTSPAILEQLPIEPLPPQADTDPDLHA